MKNPFVFATLFICCISAIKIPIFEAEEIFKNKMGLCFKGWMNLKIDESEEIKFVKLVIEEILTATLGEPKNLLISGNNGPDVLLSKYIIDSYQKVTYHNICHGIMVSYYTYILLNKENQDNSKNDQKINKENKKIEKKDEKIIQTNLDIKEQTDKALIFAALIHDIGHIGYTNPTCKLIGLGTPPLSGTTNRFCVLEYVPDIKNGDHCAYKSISDVAGKSDYIPVNHIFPDKNLLYQKQAQNVMEIFTLAVKWKYPGVMAPETKFVNFHQILCGSAEIQHAMIANEILSKLKPPTASVDKVFREMAVLSILFTNMDLYDFEGGQRFKFENDELYKYVGFVHYGDIIYIGDDHKTLPFTMLEGLVREFADEDKINESPNKLVNTADYFKFLKDQQFFLYNLVKKQVETNAKDKKIMNKAFIKFMDRIDIVLEYISQALEYKKLNNKNENILLKNGENKENNDMNSVNQKKNDEKAVNYELENDFLNAWNNGKVGTNKIVELI